MMLTLPEDPAPQAASPYLIDFGTVLQPSLGGPTQKVNRLGNRFGIQVTMPPMKSPKLGRIWLGRLIRAQVEGARLRWPLQGFDVGSPGDMRVKGTNTGSGLFFRNATPDYYMREGQFFSITTGGRSYLYMNGADDYVAGNGEGALEVMAPLLRVPHLDGDVISWVPYIEGVLIGDRRQWDWAISNFTNLQFEIQEME